jgi:hypothetical protein
MRKLLKISAVLLLISLAYQPTNGQSSTIEPPSLGGHEKACVITIIVPNEHTRYECKDTGKACSNVFNCLPS